MDELVARILLAPGADQTPLPSIRQLAAHYRVSPLTVHRALRHIQKLGKIYCVPSKGFFWGARQELPPMPSVPVESKLEQVKARLVSDFQCGVYHPYKALPTQQALAQLYQVAPSRIGLLFRHFEQTGILTRKGREFYISPPPSAHSETTVLLVSRCNAWGQLLFDSERETDFMKAMQRERLRLHMRLVVAGWYEESGGNGKFLDAYGREMRLQALPGVLLGAIVSTWLIGSPICVLKKLWKLNIPVSVWWEHPKALFPSSSLHRPSTVGFNISFGLSPGIAVARHLNQLGYRSIAFISPFHGSEWSNNRLDGLRQAFLYSANGLKVFTDSSHGCAWDYHKEAGVVAGEEAIRQVLASFIDHEGLLQEKAWVVVNDHTALLLMEVLRQRAIQRPYIISFDNSTIAEAYRIDSFEFHTEGMVRQMFYHLQYPGAILYKEQGLHEMMGRLVQRVTS